MADDAFFTEEAAAPPAADFGFTEEVAAVALDNGNGTDGLVVADEAFFSSAEPAAAAAAPVAAASGPPSGGGLAGDDPRVAWAEANRRALAEREAAEAAKKQELLAAAKEYLDRENKARAVQLEGRQRANREAEAAAGVAAGAVPQGSTAWERVISVCNFNSEALSKDPFKELSRYKAVLLAAKAANVSVDA